MFRTRLLAALGLITAASLCSLVAQDAKDQAPAEQPLDARTEQRLATVIAQLGSDSFTVRERAQAELQELAAQHHESVLDRAVEAYLNAVDPEIRFRLRSTMFNSVAAHARRRGFIGISMDQLFMFNRGGEPPNTVRVQAVIPNSAAQRFGIQPGDEIVKLDGKAFEKDSPPSRQLQEYVLSRTEGDPLKLTLRRGRTEMELDIELGGWPDSYDEGRKARLFANWMHSELVERGLAEPKPEVPEIRPQSLDPRFNPAPRFVPVPVVPQDLFPE